MPIKKHTPEEIIGKLREAEIKIAQGGTTLDACRRIAISEQTYYRWRTEGLKTDQLLLILPSYAEAISLVAQHLGLVTQDIFQNLAAGGPR